MEYSTPKRTEKIFCCGIFSRTLTLTDPHDDETLIVETEKIIFYSEDGIFFRNGIATNINYVAKFSATEHLSY